MGRASGALEGLETIIIRVGYLKGGWLGSFCSFVGVS